jgi:hypothetical protein
VCAWPEVSGPYATGPAPKPHCKWSGQHAAGLTRRLSLAIPRLQRQLSDHAHQRGDALARERGWEINTLTRRLGLAGRTYRDPRFAGHPRVASRGEPVPMQTEATR